jgi:CRISPR-associated protein Csd2
MTAISNRYDFVYLFDVKDGNPNGDPDAGNLPRLDPETGKGLVTDVALKRKIRNYVSMKQGDAQGYTILMQDSAVLNRAYKGAYEELGIDASKRNPKRDNENTDPTAWMCRHYFDVRTFGAVMSTGDHNAGQVRGPVQLTFARSEDAIVPLEITITRSSVTNEKDALVNDRTMGRKHIVPYGLYRAHGFISGRLANDTKKGTGFSEDDLALLWESLQQMFEHDRAAARGMMTARGLIVFKHDSDLGNASAGSLFKRVKIERTTEGAPRDFEDYAVTVNEADMPDGVTVQQLI